MEEDRQLLEQTSVQVRQELKIWEKQFAIDNDGRKAGRDDIKANIAIAAKYKEYNKLRGLLSGTVKLQKPLSTPTKRRSSTEFIQPPSKRSRTPEATPSEQRNMPTEERPDNAEHATPVVRRTMIGPTPQKDGQILGIFDLLTSETPSKTRTILGDVQLNVARTPSKKAGEHDGLIEERLRGSRTPTSTGKRFLLDSFVTPRKRKDDEINTPSSSMNILFATPAFLRRDNIFAPCTVTEEPQSPEIARPWKRRSFGRSLSGMITEMRKQEEQKVDEEWDIMQEMEEMDHEEPKSRKSTKAPKIVVEDSQVQLDVDGFVPSNVEFDADPKIGKGVNGQPRKAWKKKGLKRQTRRINMRPVTTLPQKAQEPEISSDDDEDDIPTQIVEETQLLPKAADSGYLSGFDDAGSDYDTAHEDPSEERIPKKGKSKDTDSRIEAKAKHEDATKEGKSRTEDANTKKPAKKVNADKHANFKRLKIRGSNGAKGKPAGRGRFGRKR